MQVVDKHAATIDGYPSILLPVDHAKMSKFGSSEDESFKLLSSEIKNLAEWAPHFLHKAGR